MTAPITYQWDGEAMVPLARLAKRCDEQFVIGETYALVEHQERSGATHNHEFAWLKEAWLNLPENIAVDYPSTEHLRKRALIDAGFYHEMAVDAGSNAAAIRVARGFMKQDEFCLAVIEGPIVAVRTAKSQSRRAMSRQEFQASKTAIMEVIAGMLGASPADLQRAEAA